MGKELDNNEIDEIAERVMNEWKKAKIADDELEGVSGGYDFMKYGNRIIHKLICEHPEYKDLSWSELLRLAREWYDQNDQRNAPSIPDYVHITNDSTLDPANNPNGSGKRFRFDK
jgi:hypothetical protein